MKRTSFDHSAHRTAQGTSILSTNQDILTLPVARSLYNRGHSPTKAEAKKMNQHLVDENHRLKKDFHKTHHRLKTLSLPTKRISYVNSGLNQRRLTSSFNQFRMRHRTRWNVHVISFPRPIRARRMQRC